VDCVESYLVEWATDVLATKFADADLVDALQGYFPKPSTVIGARDRMTAEAIAWLEEASELIEAGDMGGGLTRLDEALDQLRELRQIKPQTVIGLWREIPRRLHEDGYPLQRLEKYTKAHARDFALLVDYRNDLTHANVSHPDVLSSEPEASRPARTTTTALTELPPGWAVGVVAERIQQLHRETGTTPPGWATVPTIGQEDAPF